MNPVGPKSCRVTTGTGPGAPGNDSNGWNSEGGTDIRASAPRSDHWSTFMTSPPMATR